MANEIRGYSDEAVKTLSDDAFGVKKYVEGLCEFIKTCNTPMTISIQGDWGSGKTSMMNMIKEQISDKVHSVWFNTWQYSQFNMHDELTVSMLCALLAELKCDKEMKKEIVGAVGKFFKKATKVAVNVAAETYGVEKILKQVTDVMEPNTSDFAEEVKKLKEQFQKAVDNVLSGEGKNRVVIFVDDLDRLQPSKAVELLEVLKVFLDCEKCVYVLAVDYSVVTQGIKQKFGDLVGEEKGKSFFDKIIQLPFKMPVAQYDVNNYVEKAFDRMGMKFKDESEVNAYVELVKASIGFNPRSMKRLFNTYQLLNIILKSELANKFEEQKLLFAIICMQMEYDELYKYIVENRNELDNDMLVELSTIDRSEDVDINNEWKEKIGIDDDVVLFRMSSFVKKFNEAIDFNRNKEISKDEIEKLREMLSFSTVTSVEVGNDALTASTDDYTFREINYHRIGKEINKALKENYNYDFKKYQPGLGNPDNKYSDVFGRLSRETKLGLNYVVEYSIKTDYKSKTTKFKVAVYNGKETKKFDEFFQDAPIHSEDLSEQCECIHKDGVYEYKNIIDDFDAYYPGPHLNTMVRVLRKVVQGIERYVKKRISELKSFNG